jgi:hypothetical protein
MKLAFSRKYSHLFFVRYSGILPIAQLLKIIFSLHCMISPGSAKTVACGYTFSGSCFSDWLVAKINFLTSFWCEKVECCPVLVHP